MGIKFNSFPIRGIDVSEFNGSIDWSKVNCNFSAVRVGYGQTVDYRFAQNWQNAKGKVKRIPYWYMDYYSNHISGNKWNGISDVDWGYKQAELAWSLLKDDMEGILFLDIESTNGTYAPKIQEVQERALTIAGAFLSRFDQLSGRTNGIYASLGLLSWFYSKFRTRPLWVAWYPFRTYAPDADDIIYMVEKNGWLVKPLIWQYASDGDMDDNGTADGRSFGMQYDQFDLNGWIGTEAEYYAMFGAIETPDDEVVVIPQPTYISKTVNVSSWSSLQLRLEPVNGKVIGKLLAGAPVNIEKVINGWAKLYGQPGWVSDTYLK